MNIAICDHNTEDRRKLEEFIEPYAKEFSLKVSVFDSGDEMIAYLQKSDCGIIITDIEANGISEKDIVRLLRSKDRRAVVIVTTMDMQYAQVNTSSVVFFSLTKPFNESMFAKIFEEAINQYRTLRYNYIVRWRDSEVTLLYGNILYIEAAQRHLVIHTVKKNYECVGKISVEYEKLRIYGFVRCHQGYLVNIRKIRCIDKNTVELINGDVISVSRQCRTELRKQYNKHIKRTGI